MPKFDFLSSLITATIFLAGTNLSGQTLCSDLGDPFAGFPDIGAFGYCIPSSPGALGEPAAVNLSGLPFPVPDSGRIDILSRFRLLTVWSRVTLSRTLRTPPFLHGARGGRILLAEQQVILL